MTKAELHLRQTLVDSMPRDEMLSAIVGHLRYACRRSSPNASPRLWYSAPFVTRTRDGGPCK